jgi:hypothetical protein
MQQILLKINNKIQNDWPKFSIVGVISDIFCSIRFYDTSVVPNLGMI